MIIVIIIVMIFSLIVVVVVEVEVVVIVEVSSLSFPICLLSFIDVYIYVCKSSTFTCRWLRRVRRRLSLAVRHAVQKGEVKFDMRLHRNTFRTDTKRRKGSLAILTFSAILRYRIRGCKIQETMVYKVEAFGISVNVSFLSMITDSQYCKQIDTMKKIVKT